MRLQVEILRQSLPSVNIIFNTSSTHHTVKTVSEFLAALHKVVPLESADGEWGLEDYIVEVAATSDQINFYECLHYQLIKDVFREDDEVVVRGLTSDEIRERRQGGRFQILSDGRHLFDGVAWGRRYNMNAHRPGITIPPRKRRRLLTNGDEIGESNDTPLYLNHLQQDPQFASDFDDGDEDDEYEDDEDEDEEYYSEQNDDKDKDGEGANDLDDGTTIEIDGKPLQIIARQEFDDADADSEREEELQSDGEGDIGALEDEELQLLLQEADEVENAYKSLPLEDRITSPPKKRKRTSVDDEQSAKRNVTFEGFSSPKERATEHSSSPKIGENNIKGRIGPHAVIEAVNGSLDMHIDSESGDEDVDDSESSSSSGESESSTESESESDDETSDSGSDTSSSGSEETSNSDTTSSSGESIAESDSDIVDTPTSKKGTPKTILASKQIDGEPTNKERGDNPPGSGTKRTRLNNDRVKRRKLLLRLKEQGILPPEADFEVLRAYEAEQNQTLHDEEQESADQSLASDLAQRKQDMLARLNSIYTHDTADKAQDTGSTQLEAAKQQADIQSARPEDVQVNVDKKNVMIEELPQLEDPPRRMKLDVESSRRMLFNSLGLRNPKTPAAEQALREKLSQPVQKKGAKDSSQAQSNPIAEATEASWKNKLIISAVECVQEGLVLSPPPFPFKQRWERGIQKKKARLSKQYYQDDTVAEHDEVAYEASDPQHQANQAILSTQSAQPTGDDGDDYDDIPYPHDLESYPTLSPSDIQINTIIAYKELQLNPRFEPEESPYRVARVVAINGGSIDVVLAKSDRRPAKSVHVDVSTGQRILSKFDMPGEDDEEDDGLREYEFEAFINPKLIQTAQIQVPNSEQTGDPKVAAMHVEEGQTYVPDSAPQYDSGGVSVGISQVEVNTPRRNEISDMIEHAGFKTSLDEQLLQPIDLPQSQRDGGGSSTEQPSTTIRATTTRSTATPRRTVPMDQWESSPFQPDAENDTSQPKDQQDSLLTEDPSSPPTVSMVETVDYPHVSQIDINHASLTDQAGSSSHQDAQRISPEAFDIEHSDLTHLRIKQAALLSRNDSQASSLASEVPLSQVDTLSHQPPQNQPSVGGDGANDAPVRIRGAKRKPGFEHGTDRESVDSDGLPSLRSLTSSQRQRLQRGHRSRTSSSEDFAPKISPPPLRNDRSSASPEPFIKISASQKQALPLLSQIPRNEISVIDLTMSSETGEPNIDDRGGAVEEDDYESPRAKRRVARTAKVELSQQESHRQAKAGKSAFTAFGNTKKPICGKKLRSQV